MEYTNTTDYYQILGVSPTASNKEIIQAYRKLSLQWHPDKNLDKQEAENKFKEISEAYQILINVESRALYDTKRKANTIQLKDPQDLFSEIWTEILKQQLLKKTKHWTWLGLISGTLAGFVLGGLPGAVMGGVVTTVGGAVKDTTGKDIYSVWHDIPLDKRRELLEMLQLLLEDEPNLPQTNQQNANYHSEI